MLLFLFAWNQLQSWVWCTYLYLHWRSYHWSIGIAIWLNDRWLAISLYPRLTILFYHGKGKNTFSGSLLIIFFVSCFKILIILPFIVEMGFLWQYFILPFVKTVVYDKKVINFKLNSFIIGHYFFIFDFGRLNIFYPTLREWVIHWNLFLLIESISIWKWGFRWWLYAFDWHWGKLWYRGVLQTRKTRLFLGMLLIRTLKSILKIYLHIILSWYFVVSDFVIHPFNQL